MYLSISIAREEEEEWKGEVERREGQVNECRVRSILREEKGRWEWKKEEERRGREEENCRVQENVIE